MSLLLSFVAAAFPALQEPVSPPPAELVAEDLSTAAKIVGLDFTAPEIELMLDDVIGRLGEFEALRRVELGNDVSLATGFSPWIPGVGSRSSQLGGAPLTAPRVERPERLEDVCFWSLPKLGALLRQTDVTSVELTKMYLARIKRLDEHLHCVITLTEERALAQAQERDVELAAGTDRGPLHGIPWGVKDLMAVEGLSLIHI